MSRRAWTMIGLALAVLGPWRPAPAALARELAVLRSWNGKVADASLLRQAPEAGFVVADGDWARLWRAWRPNEAVPPVDFRRELILVFTADGPNSVGCEPRLEPDGNVRALAMSTLMAGPGFGYLIQCVPRAGVRAVNGKPLPGEAPLPVPQRGRGRPTAHEGAEPGSAGGGMDGVVSSDAQGVVTIEAPPVGAPGVSPGVAPGELPQVADALVPPLREVGGLTPRPAVFDAASRTAPIVLRSADEAVRHFAAADAAALAKQVDFARQFVLVFAWRGSGQDRLDAAVAESYPEQVFFTHRPGRTRDLREHVRIFALRRNVAWSVR